MCWSGEVHFQEILRANPLTGSSREIGKQLSIAHNYFYGRFFHINANNTGYKQMQSFYIKPLDVLEYDCSVHIIFTLTVKTSLKFYLEASQWVKRSLSSSGQKHLALEHQKQLCMWAMQQNCPFDLPCFLCSGLYAAGRCFHSRSVPGAVTCDGPRCSLWKVKVPVNKWCSCQTAAAGGSAACQLQLRRSLTGVRVKRISWEVQVCRVAKLHPGWELCRAADIKTWAKESGPLGSCRCAIIS